MCGIWSDELHEKFELTAGYGVTMSKGVHIVLPGSAIKSDAGLFKDRGFCPLLDSLGR